MLLFQKRFHAGLVDGTVTRTFRAWDKPHVKAGGRYRVHPIGVVEVDAVARVPLGAVTDDAARAGGFASKAELLEYLAPVAKAPLGPASLVFDVTLHHAGDGDRVPQALDADCTPQSLADLEARLARLDARGPWTRRVLTLIRRRPRVAASKLAASLGLETLPFKADVRKLKRLGLTQSFEVGYELSPRGVAWLEASRGRRARPGARPAAARRRRVSPR